jgi:hypothetical protein
VSNTADVDLDNQNSCWVEHQSRASRSLSFMIINDHATLDHLVEQTKRLQEMGVFDVTTGKYYENYQ